MMQVPPGAGHVNLTLVSHTNAGKTTLMRTLLRRDIGEVADRAHVTEVVEQHVLVDTPEGDVLRLWDTPGFGDSARLLKRLRNSSNPIGWIQTQVWDRLTDRPFFSTQQALRNVREESDVVLYLVNAAEDPASAGYVVAELEILCWIGKPVLLLLNQTGQGRVRDAEAADEAAWSRHLADSVPARGAVTLDAFARCWVQEDRVLEEASALLAADKQGSFSRLRAAWRRRNLEVFDQSMQAIALQLAAAAADGEAVAESGGVVTRARQWFASLARSGSVDAATDAAMNRLAARLEQGILASADRLIALHGLSGRAKAQILARASGQFELATPMDPVKSGVGGGMLSGAVGGLAADVIAGGLTFGAGALVGGILGAFAIGGAARAYNRMVGEEEGNVKWSAEFMGQQVENALLRYLAVAHYGRGRGAWAEDESPTHWLPAVTAAMAARREQVESLWESPARTAQDTALRLQAVVADAAREVLQRLYPECRGIFTPAPRTEG